MNSIDANVMDMGSQIIQLENLEMENGVLTPEQYLELLCLYLRLDRIMDAKFMWKRVPVSMKIPESLLQKVWGLTVFLLKKQNSKFLSVCQELLKSLTIPPSILPRISAVYQRVLCSTVDSIKSSYSSISLEKLSTLLSLAPNEAAILMRGWTLSSDGLYLIEPSNAHQQQLTGSDNSKLMSEFLSTLTEFSSFMENTEALPNQAELGQASVPGSLRLECPLCAFHTTDAIGLRRHAWREHLPDDSATTTTFQSRIILCCECGAATTDASSLQDHYSIVHGIDDADARVKVRWITLSRNAVTMEPSTTLSNATFIPPFPTTIKPPSVTAEDLENNYEDDDNEELDDNECVPEEPSTSDFSPPPIESLREDCAFSSSPPIIHTSTPVVSVVPESQDWSQLISRVEKKFSCLLCANSSPSVYYYNGRTEVVFHVVTRHLLRKEIEDDLAHHMKLTNSLKQRIGVLFVDGMHIRSGVHYKDAERVEAALFRSVELHLRWKALPGLDPTSPPQNMFTCSGCQAVFHNEQMAVSHINQELRSQLPDFMRARSCPWSLSTRDEWVWCVPDLQVSPIISLQPPSLHLSLGSSPPRDFFSAATLFAPDAPSGSSGLLFASSISPSSHSRRY